MERKKDAYDGDCDGKSKRVWDYVISCLGVVTVKLEDKQGEDVMSRTILSPLLPNLHVPCLDIRPDRFSGKRKQKMGMKIHYHFCVKSFILSF